MLCDYDNWDYETPEFIREDIVVAHKEHKCCECRVPIKPKQKYQYAVMVCGGIFETFKTCLPCASIREEYCGSYGNLKQDIYNILEIWDYTKPEEN